MGKVETKLKHYTYPQIAAGTGLSISCVTKLFSGHRRGWAGSLEKIAQFLNIGSGELYDYLKTKWKTPIAA